MVGSLFAQKYPDYPIDKVLSLQEQKAMGISKLNNTEKEQLRIFIIETYLDGFEQGKKEGLEQAAKYHSQQQYSDIIESRIDGDFEGWDGETVVKLMNGQIWQQTEFYYHYTYKFMPNVIIYNSGSNYKMKVDGIDKEVGVIRLK